MYEVSDEWLAQPFMRCCFPETINLRSNKMVQDILLLSLSTGIAIRRGGGDCLDIGFGIKWYGSG